MLAALVLLGGSSHAQTDPVAATQTLRLFRTTGTTRIQIQPPPTFSTYAMIWGTQPVGRNAVIYGHGYTVPTQLRLTNSSETTNDIFRMSDDVPPVPGWYPRNPNIWVTSGGNPVLGGTYVSSGELGAAPDAGSQWFGTTNTWPIYLVAGASPSNFVRGIMSADGVLSLDSALLVSLFPTSVETNLVAITNDSVPTSMMVRSQGSIRIRDINTNAGTTASPIPGTLRADSNTVFGARILSGTDLRTQLNTLVGAQAFRTGLLAGQAGQNPTTNFIYFSGIRNTAMGYLSGASSNFGALGAYFGANTISAATGYFFGEVAFGSNILRLYSPFSTNVAARFFTPIPANASQIAPITAVGAGALTAYSSPLSLMPYHVALGSEALSSTGGSRNNIAIGQKAAKNINLSALPATISDAMYITRDSSSNFLMLGALLRGRLLVNAPASVFNFAAARDPNETDVSLHLYAGGDSDEDGNPDPTPLDQYTVDGTTILSPTIVDPTLRLTVPDALPPNMNDDATRGVRTGGTTAQVIDGNRAPAVGATLPAWVDNEWVGYRVMITSGPQAGQIREITANTGNVLTVASVWSPAITPDSKYAILPSFFETERPAAATTQYTVPTFQLDLQGNVHMRPYGTGVGEDAAFGQVAEMRFYDLTNFETGQRTAGGAATLTDATKSWPTNIYANAIVRIVEGAGVGQTRRVISNTNTTLTVATNFSPALNNTSKYEIEIVEETGTATAASASSITDVTKNWTSEFLDFTGAQIRITGGLGVGQTRTVVSSTSNLINVYPPFTITPNTTSTYSISRWFPRYVGFRAANNVPYPSWNVFMNLPEPTGIPVGARYVLTITDDAPLTLDWVGIGSMAFPHTWDNKSADIGESIDISPLFGWPAAGYPFGSTGTAEQSLIMGKKLALNGPPAVPFASRVPQANFTTGFGFRVMNSFDAVADAGDSNTAIGARAMFAATTGGSNVAIGKDALLSLTSGSSNVAIGYSALASLVSDSNSVAIGANALRSSVATTGANTAIGESAMELLTTGISNTAIGSKAMRSASTAARNVVIGDNGATSLTSGTGNAVVGANSAPVLTVGIDNVLVGANSAPLLTTGGSNVVVGANSAPALTTGNRNIAVGAQALASGATFDDMVAIGGGALRSLTSGTFNLAIGRFAMENSVDASGNVAIGDSTLRNAQTGNFNVAIGAGSLISLTTGDNNIAAGDSVMFSLTTGSDNVAIGRRALRSNVSASGNIAIGDTTLRLLTSGSDNVAIGGGALTSLTNGSNNIAVGRRALASLSTGSDNIAIGPFALTSLTTASGFIAIGDSAMAFVSTGAGQPIAIGSRAMRSLVTSAGTNIAVGQQALYSVTSSFDNIAIGSLALYSHTSGDGRNIAIGGRALFGSTAGVDNVAIGDSAMFGGGGRYNVAVGAGALRSLDNPLAYGNVAVGTSAMWAARGARYNVAVGDSSMTSIIEGWGNVAVGGASLVSSTLTYDNTAVGDSALASNSIGRDNVAIGRLTMAGVGTGPMFSNVAVGTFALRSLTAGAGNTAIGASTLLGLTTGGEIDSGNVALGNLAGARAPAGTKNALFIANTDATALLFGRFGAGRLMINATLPVGGPLPTLNAALQVNSNASTDRGVVVRMAAAPTVSPVIIQNNLEATTFEIQTSGAFPSIAGVNYTWPGAAPAAAAAGTQTGRAAMTVASTGVLSFTQLTTSIVTDPLNVPPLPANTSADLVVPNPVLGAAPGDVVALGLPVDAANANLVSFHAWVSANDQVTIRVNNFGANPVVAQANQVFRVIVVK